MTAEPGPYTDCDIFVAPVGSPLDGTPTSPGRAWLLVGILDYTVIGETGVVIYGTCLYPDDQLESHVGQERDWLLTPTTPGDPALVASGRAVLTPPRTDRCGIEVRCPIPNLPTGETFRLVE